MTRPIALFAALATLVTPAARADSPAVAAEAPADLSAETTSFDAVSGDTVLTGEAKLVDAGILLTADEIRINQRTQKAVATGHVVMTRIGDRMLADRVTFNRANASFSAQNLRIGRFPYYIEGPAAEGNRTEVVIHDATVTFGEPGKWQPNIKAKTITYSQGHYLRLSGASVGVGGYRPLPVARLGQDLAHESGLASIKVDGGYRHTLGAYIDTGLNYPISNGLTAGPDIGVYTFRGLLLGPLANYDITKGDDSMQGYLRSGYIYDFGNRLTDILNNPVPPNRAYIEWQHTQQLTPDITLNGDINWSSDSEVIRDFHSKDFVPIQEPDNFLEGVYTGTNYLGSVFTRFQPDPFYPVQERLPEIRFDLLPTALGGGFFVRSDSSLAHLEENPVEGGAHLESDRFDTFVGLTRPITYKGYFDFDPVVGGRFTDYFQTEGAVNPGGTARVLGEVGFDADLRMSATFDYENPLWHIDGLRHLITPTLSYRYIPDGNKSSDWIPPIDRYTFTTYLPIMELGDMRALDQIQAQNVLRVGLNNTLQTRDKTYGSKDLLTFNVEDDFRLQRSAGQGEYSDVYGELTATPARWLEIRVEDSVASNGFAQRARDATITVKEADVWSAGVGWGFLTDNYGTYSLPGLGTFPVVGLDTYHLEARVRLNEQYETFARGDYDARNKLIVDQFYGFTQKVSNTWIVEYAVVFSQGPNKGQGHFGLNVTLNMVRF